MQTSGRPILGQKNPAEATDNRLRRGLEYLTLGLGGLREMGPRISEGA